MSNHVFLIDVTRHKGQVESVVNSALSYARSFEPAKVEWFCVASQAPVVTAVVPAEDGTVNSADLVGPELWKVMHAKLLALSHNGNGSATFHVLSYDKQVLMAADGLSSKDLTVRSYSLASIRTAQRTGGAPRAFVAAPRSGSISVAEAVELTKKILAEAGAVSADSALLVSALRPLLVKRDKRAAKIVGDAGSVRLSSEILADGRINGWMGLEVPFAGGERIWLLSTGTVQKSASLIAVPPEAGTAPEPKLPERPDRGKQRSEMMVKCLKDRGVYSPKQIRDYFFSEIEAIRKQPGALSMTVSQLVRQVRTRAEERAKAEGVEYGFWPVAADAILEMLLAARTLIGTDSQAIRPGIHARGANVSSIRENFQDACESFLLQTVISELKDVTVHDRTSLAHALFKLGRDKGSIESMQDRVDFLFNRLGFDLVEDPVTRHLTVECHTAVASSAVH